MAKQQPAVMPQRQTPKGWQQCEPHQAHMWAVVIGCHTIGRYGNKALALEVLGTYLISKQKPSRRYQLGGVMPKRADGQGSYATSCTREQYEQLKLSHTR